MKKVIYLIIFLGLSIIMACTGKLDRSNGQPADSVILGKLVIFHAGSLSFPLKEIAQEFRKINPDVEILMEAAGSLACARKITELNQECDIIAVSDYKVIDHMLIPKYCQWNIPFAGNEMIIAYRPDSKYTSEIKTNNWFEILMKKDVHFGRSDPNSDPCGYRSILTMELSDLFYKQDISNSMQLKDQKYIRPKETDLIALLEEKELDYIFIYRSVAIQHHLNFLILPDSINLKKPELDKLYSGAKLEIIGNEPGQKQLVQGESMIYGISIPEKAPNRKAAESFLAYLFSPENGMKIMEKNGQNPIPPKVNTNYDKVPLVLKKFVLEK
jgi:molybdate/tungstate transport system substrate-binding protein